MSKQICSGQLRGRAPSPPPEGSRPRAVPTAQPGAGQNLPSGLSGHAAHQGRAVPAALPRSAEGHASQASQGLLHQPGKVHGVQPSPDSPLQALNYCAQDGEGGIPHPNLSGTLPTSPDLFPSRTALGFCRDGLAMPWSSPTQGPRHSHHSFVQGSFEQASCRCRRFCCCEPLSPHARISSKSWFFPRVPLRTKLKPLQTFPGDIQGIASCKDTQRTERNHSKEQHTQSGTEVMPCSCRQAVSRRVRRVVERGERKQWRKRGNHP